ncbi:hypothetical protein RHO15_03320 [Utexia brackfieldae]|uniref:hypothetical protein n=1 Tax=Utexia brackfieldae TaxID=3074108 RepID=UPI00370DCFE8
MRAVMGLSLGLFLCLSAVLSFACRAAADMLTDQQLNPMMKTLAVDASGKVMHYSVALLSPQAPPETALIVIHGYPHDVNKTLAAAVLAAEKAQQTHLVIVAPLFQADAQAAKKCHRHGRPPSADELQWTCGSWTQGGLAVNAAVSTYQALDALIMSLKIAYPTVNSVTVAGFSASAQMIQHYIGFSALPANLSLHLRYVIADPGSWLYFDDSHSRLPFIQSKLGKMGITALATCPTVNDWKYGLNKMPTHLAAQVSRAKAQYRQADIHYLEGARDQGDWPRAHQAILDKSCAANAQGDSRLQRGIVYMAYARAMLKMPSAFSVVPNCAHDVTCVFTSAEGQQALFGTVN